MIAMDDWIMDNWITDILAASVSSGDAAAVSDEGETAGPERYTPPGAVPPSAADVGTSVSGGDITLYQIEVYTVSGSDQELQYTLFDKPLDEYTVSEGLLLILVIIAVGAVVWTAVKEGFRWLSW